MATLIIERAEAFHRGDQSIRIRLDGKDIGMLPLHEPLIREIDQGRHQVRAWMNGLSGSRMSIHADGEETVRLVLSGTHPPQFTWRETALFVLTCVLSGSITGDALGGTGSWIKGILFALTIGYVIYRQRQWLQQVLMLRPAGGEFPVAEQGLT